MEEGLRMTEKRFVAIGVEWTDGFIQDHVGDRDLFNVGAVCKLLNELSEENKQLKADNNRLVNETAKIVAEHQGRVLDLIDKRIDKCEPIDYARNIEGDVPVFDCETATEIRVLNELKKELEND